MNHPAPVDHPIHPLLRERWSPRAFHEGPIPADVLRTLLEAARWAPSCFNDQPWAFILATRDQPEDFARLVDLLGDANKRWAPQAPLLIITAARLAFERTGKPNAHAWYDVGQSVAHLTFQAEAMGLRVHQMAGFDRARAREVLGLPEGWEATTAIAVGYGAEPEVLPEDLAARERAPRQRRAQDEIAFFGRFGAR